MIKHLVQIILQWSGRQKIRQSWSIQIWMMLFLLFWSSSCIRYSFSGAALPAGVSTIYIPFFQDNSGSGVADLSDRLNEALVNRFVNQTRLRLVNDPALADIILEGSINTYTVQPFSIGGDQRADMNRVTINVRASYKFTSEDRARWDKSFSGNAEFELAGDAIAEELAAAGDALNRIAQNMFSDSLGRW